MEKRDNIVIKETRSFYLYQRCVAVFSSTSIVNFHIQKVTRTRESLHLVAI